jgi:transcriptional regulator GlxA family with amidase domain
MTIARGLLRDTNGSLSSIAQQIGYGSEAAFSKAFKEVIGVSPGTYRRRE